MDFDDFSGAPSPSFDDGPDTSHDSGPHDAAVDAVVSSESASGSEDKPETEAEASKTGKGDKPEAKAKAKDGEQKVKVGDEELTLDEIRHRLSPDYEHTIKANGQEIKRRYADLIRDAQLGQGAHAKMAEAAQMRKELEAQRERMASDPRGWLDEHLDRSKYPGGAKSLAAEIARENIAIERRLAELAKSDDPADHRRHREMLEQMAEERARAKVEHEQRMREREAQQRAAEEQRAKLRAQIPKALSGVGLDLTPGTYAHLTRIHSQYRDVGHDLSLEDAAAMAAEQYTSEIGKFIAGKLERGGAEEVLKVLGPEVRKALREHEVKLAKPKPKSNGNSESKPRSSNGHQEIGRAKRMEDLLDEFQ